MTHRDEIQVIGKTIILGIFENWNYQKFSLPFLKYWKFEDEFEYIPDLNIAFKHRIIDNVINACKKCDRIVFVLDDVYFPIDINKSVTCKELLLICRNESFYNKTIFVKGENVVNFDKNLVL